LTEAPEQAVPTPERPWKITPGEGLCAQSKARLPRTYGYDAVIAFDGCAGLVLAAVLFSTPSTILTVLLGASAAMLPDPLQFAYTLYPHEPLKSLQRFHGWMHTKHQIGTRIGVSSQIAFVAAVIGIRAILP